ncbi:arylesterase [Defluviimonas sp. WL0024]|uniref:Arylesterase n=2 Tax=Albidovulum TaxID=205889 RepID=A0ABT3J766_9RHOB|nr:MULTISPECIES: arylesterase [Defluviimonas]MCU9847285.1 arylesterase [Defluviimonas sp. WL0024]MCW3783506.1 arylesterase [Defluviimonas salinarum]
MLAALVPAGAAAEPLTLLAFGDSLTAGYGLPPEEGFVQQLQGWLAEHGAEVTVLNGGVSGDTTAGGLARIDWALTPEVDAMIVTLGGNDLLRGLPPEEARANLDAILDRADERQLPVLLVPMTAPGNYGPDYKDAFDAIYPELAKEHGARLAPPFLSPILAQEDRAAAIAAYIQPDGLHPNAEGVALVVEGLGPEVLDMLDSAE